MMKLKLRHRRLRKFRKIKSLRRQHSRCRYFHLTHIDFLFFDVFNGAFWGFTFINDQTQFYT